MGFRIGGICGLEVMCSRVGGCRIRQHGVREPTMVTVSNGSRVLDICWRVYGCNLVIFFCCHFSRVLLSLLILVSLLCFAVVIRVEDGGRVLSLSLLAGRYSDGF